MLKVTLIVKPKLQIKRFNMSKIELIQICAEGTVQSFLAKGDHSEEVMKEAAHEQFVPSQYEDHPIDLSRAKVVQGRYRWVPYNDEFGDPCGSKLIEAKEGGRGSFFATELIVG
jgi:hypothetical protein